MPEPNCFRSGSVHAIEATEKYAAIAELIGKADVFAEVGDLGLFEAAVVDREKSGSTGLGRGVAVAHGKTPLADRVIVALGISRRGIEFEAPDGLPVKLLFLVASPPEMSCEYLLALSAIAGLCRNDDLKERLLAVSADEAGRLAVESFGRILNQRCEGLTADLALSALL